MRRRRPSVDSGDRNDGGSLLFATDGLTIRCMRYLVAPSFQDDIADFVMVAGCLSRTDRAGRACSAQPCSLVVHLEPVLNIVHRHGMVSTAIEDVRRLHIGRDSVFNLCLSKRDGRTSPRRVVSLTLTFREEDVIYIKKGDVSHTAVTRRFSRLDASFSSSLSCMRRLSSFISSCTLMRLL